jgi:hypothetical protein
MYLLQTLHPVKCTTVVFIDHLFLFQAVMREFRDVVIAYGESDEYSFVLRRSTEMYGECNVACTLTCKLSRCVLCHFGRGTGHCAIFLQDGGPPNWCRSYAPASPATTCVSGMSTCEARNYKPRRPLMRARCCTPRTRACGTTWPGGRLTHTSTTRSVSTSVTQALALHMWCVCNISSETS